MRALFANQGADRSLLWLNLRRQRPSAKELLRRFGIVSPPVDVVGLARAMGVEVVRLGFDEPDVSGLVDIHDDPPRAIIKFSPRDAPVRQRFTVAHELAHLMLHTGTHYRDGPFNGSREEVAANRYAADLLMPVEMVDAYGSKYGPNVQLLASIFRVSAQAMEIRLGYLAGVR